MKVQQLTSEPPDSRQNLLTRHLPPKSKDKSEQGFAPFEPIEADGGEECLALLRLHVTACLAKKAERPIREILQDPQTHAGLLRAAGNIGTHNPKVPNANVSGLCLFTLEPGLGEELPPGASSRTTLCLRHVGSQGNAEITRFIDFLAKEFIINGLTISVAEDFANRGQFFDAAVEEGLPHSVAEIVSKQLKKRLDTDRAIHRLLKQIYWPTEDGGYCLISPVQSIGILGETVLRIDSAVRKHQHRVPRAYTKVAGSNQLNAGRLNLEIAGLHPHLLCLPPQRDHRGGDWYPALLAQLASGNLFHPGLLSKQTVETLQSTFADSRTNVQAKHRFEHNLADAAREALKQAKELAEALQEEEACRLLEERYARLPAELKAWLDPRSQDLPETAPLDKDLLAALAGQIYNAVFAKHKLLGDKDITSPELRTAIIQAIQEAL